MTTTGVSHPPETNSNVVTSWLPLTSAFAPASECATAGIYSQIDSGAGGALAIAFDPFYGININRTLTCLPPVATLWWTQSATVPLLTHTSLGPFVCPGGYTTATTSAVNDISTFVGCCPSNYVFAGTKDSGTIGQCNSHLSVGQVMTYIDLTTSPHTTRATISAAGASVFAVHVNGYVFAPSSTTSSLSSASSATSAAGSVVSPTSSTTSSPTITPSSGGLSTGAKAGIGIGVSLGVLGICSLLLGLRLIRRHRKEGALSGNTAYSNGSSRNDDWPGQRYELGESHTLYEMSGTPRELK